MGETSYAVLGEEVYARLRRMILDGEIAARVPIREAELVRRMGTSRTPVREALRRLQAEGLLTPIPHLGYVVNEVGIEDLVKIFPVREVLEGLASRLAALHRGRTDLARMADLMDEMEQAVARCDNDRLDHLDAAFHNAIARASRNEYLESALANLREAYRRYRPPRAWNARRRREMLAEHRALLQAMDDGDPDRAERLAKEHNARAVRFRLEAAGIVGEHLPTMVTSSGKLLPESGAKTEVEQGSPLVVAALTSEEQG